MANRSKVMEFSGRPSLDILKQGRNLLDNTRLECIFYPNDPTFAIQRNAGCTKDAKIKILDARLCMKIFQRNPGDYITQPLLVKYSISLQDLFSLVQVMSF